MRPLRQRILLGVSAVLVLGVAPLFASCAESSAGSGPDAAVDPNVLTPTPDAGADSSPGDGGCDASEKDCVTHQLSCDEAPWCPVATTVSGFYALTAVWGSSKSDVWAVGSGGTIVHWDGTAWSPTPVGVKNTFNAIWGSGPNDVWTVSATDAVFHSTGYAGAATTWTRTTLPVAEDNEAPLFAIWGSGANDFHLAGRSFLIGEVGSDFIQANTFVPTTLPDGGAGWQPIEGTANVFGLWGPRKGEVWLVGDNSNVANWQLGYTLHGTTTNDGGISWREVDSQSSVRLRAIWGSSADDIWSVGDIGTIRHLTSATAEAWQVVASPTNERLNAIWGSAPDNVWAVGEAGVILHYDGTSWSRVTAAYPLGKKPSLYGVWGAARDDVWIVGSGGALHYTGGQLGNAGGTP